MIQFTQEEMQTVGEMAHNCDLIKLNIATREAILFDMPPLFGRFWSEIEANWGNTSEEWENVLNGSVFECGGRERTHQGVREVLKYYTYARYIVLNGFNDTPNGHVTKQTDFSMPKPLRELETFSLKYRGMGKQLFEDVEAYLCVNRDLFIYKGNCEHCGCYDSEERTNTTGLGFRTKTIRKKWIG